MSFARNDARRKGGVTPFGHKNAKNPCYESIFPYSVFIFPFFCLTLVNCNGANKMNALRKVIRFYVEGFREMTVGRTLWAVILVKLFIMFAVLKVFFFRSPMRGLDAGQRTETVLRNLTDTLRNDLRQSETTPVQ